MGHFSHDLQPQHGSSPAICLAASWPACPSAMGLSIKENACCLLHCLCLEQPLLQHLSLVPGHPHHLSVLFSSTSQKHACVTVSNSGCASQSADTQFCCCQGPQKEGTGEAVVGPLLTCETSPQPSFTKPYPQVLGRAGRSEELQVKQERGSCCCCWLMGETQRLHYHPGSGQEMLICMPRAYFCILR